MDVSSIPTLAFPVFALAQRDAKKPEDFLRLF
jgi:hypothetical protein